MQVKMRIHGVAILAQILQKIVQKKNKNKMFNKQI